MSVSILFLTAKGNGQALTSLQIVRIIILILSTATENANQQGNRKHRVDHLLLTCDIFF